MKKNKASDKVYKYIEDKILKKEWKSGDKITPELELTELLGVSRVSTREAIQKLVTLKVLTKKVGVGGGTFINRATPDDYLENLLPLLILGESSYSEIMVLRSVLEPLSVQLFISNCDEKACSELEEAYNKMVANTDNPDEFLKYDILFHRIIARGSKNSLLDKILEMILNMNEHYAHDHYRGFAFEKNIEDHASILNAIKNKEIEISTTYMKRHIERKIIVV
jgi:DNA-binding FadR family transcriptional regulator